MPKLEIWFVVVAFGPFVPSVDEHDGFGEAFQSGAIGEHGAETEAVGLGSRGGAAGGVEPGWHHAGDAEVVDWEAGQQGGHHLGGGEHAVVAERMGSGQAELVEQVQAARWSGWRGVIFPDRGGPSEAYSFCWSNRSRKEKPACKSSRFRQRGRSKGCLKMNQSWQKKKTSIQYLRCRICLMLAILRNG